MYPVISRMNSKYNYIIVDNPNGKPKEAATVPFAQLVDAPLNMKNVFENGVANVSVKDMYLPNYSMRISKGVFTQDAIFLNTSANGLDYLGSCLFPDGRFVSHAATEKKVIESEKGTQNFKFDPLNEYQHRISANTPFHLIHFSVNPNHLFQFLPEDEDWSHYLRNKIQRNEKVIGDRSTPILLAQQRALQTIFDCPLTGRMAEMMIETSITQIILLQLHSIFQKKECANKALSKRDQDIVQNLKEYLAKNFLCDHSLDNLARHFATNTNKLMVLFKKAFGKSIFDYISELRMEYAHRLLKEEEKMIIEVAREVGYKNPNHFSSAFKKKFGINPSQV
jgi:AraC-like DNA-binding protein